MSSLPDYSGSDFAKLVALDPDEVISHSYVRDIPLPSGKVLALITLDNGRDHTRPNTLGPATLIELGERLDELAARGRAGEIHAVAITGKPFILAAGADPCFIAIGQIQDDFMGRGCLGGPDHVINGGFGIGIPDVIGNGTDEQINILGDDANIAAQHFQRQLPYIHAVNLHASLVYIV